LIYTEDANTKAASRIWDERDIADLTPSQRHYHASSEPFATGDTLQTLLYRGWQPAKGLQRHVYWLSAMRSVTVYVFQLQRAGEVMQIPVLVNPFVMNIVHDMGLHIEMQEDHVEWPSKSG